VRDAKITPGELDICRIAEFCEAKSYIKPWLNYCSWKNVCAKFYEKSQIYTIREITTSTSVMNERTNKQTNQ